MRMLKTFGAGVVVVGLLAFALPGAALAGGDVVSPFAGFETVANDQLDETRGKAHIPDCNGQGCDFGIANANASSHGNHKLGDANGQNNLTGSFGDADGLFNIVQNTGDNVVVQTSIDVHITEVPTAQ